MVLLLRILFFFRGDFAHLLSVCAMRIQHKASHSLTPKQQTIRLQAVNCDEQATLFVQRILNHLIGTFEIFFAFLFYRQAAKKNNYYLYFFSIFMEPQLLTAKATVKVDKSYKTSNRKSNKITIKLKEKNIGKKRKDNHYQVKFSTQLVKRR